MSQHVTVPLDLETNEIQNAKLHQVAGAKAGATQGEYWENTTLDRLQVQGSGGVETVPFLSTSAPPTLSVGGSAVLGTSTRSMREDAKPALPGLATTSVDGFMPATDRLALSTATNAATANTLVKRDGNGRIQAADPSANTDIVTKQYLENYVTQSRAGVARVATTGANITLATAAPLVVDGITLVANDLVLVKDQTTNSQNGIYTVSSPGTGSNGVWVRASDYNSWNELVTTNIKIEEGTANQETLWLCTANRSGGTIDTTAVPYTQLPSPMSTLAGNALVKNGNVLDVNTDNSTIEISGDALRLKDSGVTNAKLATIAANRIKGGLSAGAVVDLTPAQVRTIIGSDLGSASGSVKLVGVFGDGTNNSFTITHSLGMDVMVQVYRNSAGYDTVICDVIRTATTVVISFTSVPTASQYKYVIIG